MQIELKPLNIKSEADCRKFVSFVNENYESPFPVTLADTQAGRYIFFWAVETSSSNAIGTAGLMPKTAFLAEAVKSTVAPGERGKKFGELIARAIEIEAQRRGFKKLMTTIYVTNLAMIFIRLKQGYIFEGFHPNHEMPGLHEYSMGKILGQ